MKAKAAVPTPQKTKVNSLGSPPKPTRFDIPPGILRQLNSTVGDLSEYIANNNIENASLLKALETLTAAAKNIEGLSTTTFHLFPKLPIELRLKIWREAAMFPQVIGMTEWDSEKWCQGGEKKYEKFLAGTHARCPILRTCREAREEALKMKESYYSRIEGDYSVPAPKVYVNFDVDIFWLLQSPPFAGEPNWRGEGEKEMWSKVFKGSFSRLRSLAIDYKIYHCEGYYTDDFIQRLDLQELIIVVRSEQVGTNEVGILMDLDKFDYGPDDFDWQDNVVLDGDCPVPRCWDDVAKCYTEHLKEFKAQVIKDYQSYLADGHSPAQLKAMNIRDPTEWTVPEVKFKTYS